MSFHSTPCSLGKDEVLRCSLHGAKASFCCVVRFEVSPSLEFCLQKCPVKCNCCFWSLLGSSYQLFKPQSGILKAVVMPWCQLLLWTRKKASSNPFSCRDVFAYSCQGFGSLTCCCFCSRDGCPISSLTGWSLCYLEVWHEHETGWWYCPNPLPCSDAIIVLSKSVIMSTLFLLFICPDIHGVLGVALRELPSLVESFL